MTFDNNQNPIRPNPQFHATSMQGLNPQLQPQVLGSNPELELQFPGSDANLLQYPGSNTGSSQPILATSVGYDCEMSQPPSSTSPNRNLQVVSERLLAILSKKLSQLELTQELAEEIQKLDLSLLVLGPLRRELQLLGYQTDAKEFRYVLNPQSLDQLKYALGALIQLEDMCKAAQNISNQDVVREFLQHYPEYANVMGPWGTTMLYEAVQGECLPMVQMLVEEFTCDVNLPNLRSPQSAPAHLALFKKNFAILQYLVVHGADLTIRNNHNEIPLWKINTQQLNAFPDLLRQVQALRDRLLNRHKEIAWERKREDGVWVPLPENEQNVIYQSFLDGKQATSFQIDDGSQGFACLDFTTFEIEMVGNRYRHLLRCRHPHVTDKIKVVWQYEDAHGVLQDLDDDATKVLRKAAEQNPNEQLECRIGGCLALVDLIAMTATFQVRMAERFQQCNLRWVPETGSAKELKLRLEQQQLQQEQQQHQQSQHQSTASDDDNNDDDNIPVSVMGPCKPLVELKTAGLEPVADDVNAVLKTWTEPMNLHAPPEPPILDIPTVPMHPKTEHLKPPPKISMELFLPKHPDAAISMLRILVGLRKKITTIEPMVWADVDVMPLLGSDSGGILKISGSASQIDCARELILRWTISSGRCIQLQKQMDIELSRIAANIRNGIAQLRIGKNVWPLTRELWICYLKKMKDIREKKIEELKAECKLKAEAELHKHWTLEEVHPATQWDVLQCSLIQTATTQLTSSFLETVALCHVAVELRDHGLQHVGLLAGSLISSPNQQQQQKRILLADDVIAAMNEDLLTLASKGQTPKHPIHNALNREEYRDVLALHLNLRSLVVKSAKINWRPSISAGFEHICTLLRCCSTHVKAFMLQLPLYCESTKILDQLSHCRVVAVRTGTGSGKSTVLPPLIVAAGFKQVAVTQPRRLPCTSVCSRVSSVFGKGIAGYRIAGEEVNGEAQVVYLTDGLLRQALLFDPKAEYIKYDCIVLDEVHERSLNIDVTIALLSRAMTHNKNLKVILCSATMDNEILAPFEPHGLVGELEATVPRLYPVTEHMRPNMNPISAVMEILKKRKAEERILCFLPSVADVNECKAIFEEISQSQAFALYAQQKPSEQQQCLQEGAVFFSTNIAETSLTIPNLKYVVDTGLTNRVEFLHGKQLSELKQVAASSSTISQRQGRLGRTTSGEYHALFDKKAVQRAAFPPAQMSVIDIIDVEMDLRRGIEGLGLEALINNRHLPTPPSQQSLAAAKNRLVEIGVMDPSFNLTPSLGEKLRSMPVVGNVFISVALLAALEQFHCGGDVLRLCAVMMILPTTGDALLKNLPSAFQSPNGDMDSMLWMMNETMRARASHGHGFNVRKWASMRGVKSCNLLNRAVKQYDVLLDAFRKQGIPAMWQRGVHKVTGNWELVARSLLEGFRHNVYCSMQLLDGNKSEYVRIDADTASGEKAVLVGASLLATKKAKDDPEPYILCLSQLYTPKLPGKLILSMAGKVELEWVKYPAAAVRKIVLDPSETAIAQASIPFIQLSLQGNDLTIKGPCGLACKAEIEILKHLRTQEDWTLGVQGVNRDDVLKNPAVFHPMIFRWKNTMQVEIRLHSWSGEFTIIGRKKQIEDVKTELNVFQSWLTPCGVVRIKEAGGEQKYTSNITTDMHERISAVTKATRSTVDVWNASRGPNHTRETRMSVVSWIAVTKYGARLEGGFVRDYIIAGPSRCSYPATNVPKSAWYDLTQNIPTPHADLVPPDLDLQLPYKYFDLDRFKNDLFKYGITLDRCILDKFRIVMLFDLNEPTGPFMADFIEPHIVTTHSMIDFDVNNLCLSSNVNTTISMRVSLDNGNERADIPLEVTIDNIIAQRCFQMRSNDKYMQRRIDKMKARGWDVVDDCTRYFVPSRGVNSGAVFIEEPRGTKQHDFLMQEVQNKIHGRVKAIYRISTHVLNCLYDAMRHQIRQENNGNENEIGLFHGTSQDAIQPIMDRGFDNRFYNQQGYFGAGAYFADDITKSHNYTGNTQVRSIFFCKVLMGKVHDVSQPESFIAAPREHHSVFYKGGSHPPLIHNEYIVYRYGQAVPYMRVDYYV